MQRATFADPSVRTKYLLDYGLPIATTVVATLLRLALAPLLGQALPFFTFFLASIMFAWYRGFWPAAFSVALSAIAGAHYILPSAMNGTPFGRSAEAAIIGFVVTSLTVCFLFDLQHRTLNRARKAEAAQAAIARDNAQLYAHAKASEEGLRGSNEELQRVNRDLETFAYSASHDLKEPLRTVTIYAQLLQKRIGKQLPGDEADFLKHIMTAARHMETLIEDILVYSRATKVEPGPPPSVDAGRVFEKVISSLQGQIEQAEATVTTGPLPPVQIHEGSLALLFQNLISNGIKYCGQDKPHVHIAAEQQDGRWIFSVADNGLGIDQQFGDQIFGLFKRLHPRDKYPGSGIGLAVCKRVAEHYGGNVWLHESTLGRGSVFRFSVPKRHP